MTTPNTNEYPIKEIYKITSPQKFKDNGTPALNPHIKTNQKLIPNKLPTPPRITKSIRDPYNLLRSLARKNIPHELNP